MRSEYGECIAPDVHYVLVFDAAAEPYRNLWFVAPGLVLSTVGACLVFPPQWLERVFRRPLKRRLFLRCSYFLFALCWTAIAATSVIEDVYNAQKVLQDNDCTIIAGQVAHFHPMPSSGHDTERFDVNGVEFSYSDYIVTAGFNNTASHGGPIREGLPVRICQKDGEILRLEVGR